jgi:glycosyltransferase involved in cell wall biosynthesis
VVVIDDGSTDGTAAFAAASGVRVISQANCGVAVARNAGVAATTAPWIALLDADDRWPPNSLAVRAAVIAAQPDADIVVGRIATFRSGEAPAVVDAPGYLPSAMMIRRAAFEQCGPLNPDLRNGDMIDWLDRARSLGLVFAHTETVCAERRLRAGSLAGIDSVDRGDYLKTVRTALERRRAAGTQP